MIPIFVGYDPREAVTFHVCVNSIIRHASQPVQIIPIALNLFSDYDETHSDGSNQFVYARFLVPHLMSFDGWAIYIDGDMVVRDDIVKLWDMKQYDKDVMVVKHDYKTIMQHKYMGAKNEDYPRKNWSSVILWNCNAFPNRILKPDFVQEQTGAFLHRFSWLEDHRIGELPRDWNWLPDELGENPDAKLLHYTLGAPCFYEYADTVQADQWHNELKLTTHCQQRFWPEPTVVVPHEFDQIAPEIKEIFNSILKYRVDPAGEYYGMTLQALQDKLAALPVDQIVALDSEYRYERKGHMYDPVLESFVRGAGGQVSTWDKQETTMTPAVLRGITKRKQMEACRAAGRDFYYMDTGYFGNGKKKSYHRITKNDVQNFGPIIERPRDRLDRTGVKYKKFRPGRNILLAPPSQKLLNLYDINLEEWLQQVQAEIKLHTDRPVVVRLKQGRATRVNDDTIEMALDQDVHCLVTFSSIAAGEALLWGKPAITLGPNAAAALCSNSISEIETPKIPTLDEVDAWARHIAYCQFTEYEMRDGTAWRILNDH